MTKGEISVYNRIVAPMPQPKNQQNQVSENKKRRKKKGFYFLNSKLV